jgi:hypothetical protein
MGDRKKESDEDYIKFSRHVELIQQQEGVPEEKARMMAWLEGPVAGGAREAKCSD